MIVFVFQIVLVKIVVQMVVEGVAEVATTEVYVQQIVVQGEHVHIIQ
jgi:hypothetical protein